MTRIIGPEAEAHLDWIGVTEAIAAGHDRPKAQIEDVFLRRRSDTLLNRSAWIDGMGVAVKAATVFPGQSPMINGAVSLFSDRSGALEAVLDFHLVTKWKTAGDSLLAARRLARPDSRDILIVGAGTVGLSVRQAYAAAFPEARFTVWNRSPEGAARFHSKVPDVTIAPDLEEAVGQADIVACATMSTDPVIKGDWLRPGTHVDLIGAYRADMREADDAALTRSRIFVDSRDTTLAHIGEMKDPLTRGVITPGDVVADYYDLAAFTRQSDSEITLFKNGGGAHLDLMVARYILDAVDAAVA